MFTTADNRPQTTAHLIDPQTLFSLVCGGKADNHINQYPDFKGGGPSGTIPL